MNQFFSSFQKTSFDLLWKSLVFKGSNLRVPGVAHQNLLRLPSHFPREVHGIVFNAHFLIVFIQLNNSSM
ncbi:unnamed protein product [Caenorhabditis angaria]|uniref:Uncharacterized protein n=1 Tax=Caenorhabditis angaria TaxID=860376 RepID=A0A9P1ICV9_9PELO|nr:unnamed protein product [Caenorhabditis angaria]